MYPLFISDINSFLSLCPQQLLQQATTPTNQGSYNNMQRLGGECSLSLL